MGVVLFIIALTALAVLARWLIEYEGYRWLEETSPLSEVLRVARIVIGRGSEGGGPDVHALVGAGSRI